jgi:hypothetical protein
LLALFFWKLSYRLLFLARCAFFVLQLPLSVKTRGKILKSLSRSQGTCLLLVLGYTYTNVSLIKEDCALEPKMNFGGRCTIPKTKMSE